MSASDGYRGRLAPSPTGLLHLGHARTFWTAYKRARDAGGVLVLRDEDLDTQRARADYAAAMLDDLRWLGIVWQEGPMSAVRLRHTGRVNAMGCIARHGSSCARADGSTRATAREESWPRR